TQLRRSDRMIGWRASPDTRSKRKPEPASGTRERMNESWPRCRRSIGRIGSDAVTDFPRFANGGGIGVSGLAWAPPPADKPPAMTNDALPATTPPVSTLDTRPCLRGMAMTDMAALLERGGFPGFRAKQLYHWVHRHGARSFDEMTN